MLNGLALTPPVIGRITIGKLIERHGKRLPEKDDGFTLTSQVHSKGGWIAHPLDQALRQATLGQASSAGQASPGEKLRLIPVRLLFNDPGLSFRVSYSLFDRSSGRPLCVGNGQVCRRLTREGITQMNCPTPEGCDIGANGQCKPYGRLNVHVDVPASTQAKDAAKEETQAEGKQETKQDLTKDSEDELGSFVFRTTGFNSIRTLSARLRYLHAVSGGILASLPLALRLRGKSSSNQYRSTLYYVDLTTRPGSSLADAVAQGQMLNSQRQQAGLHQAALDEAARAGLAMGAFEEDPDEGLDAVQEFYPEGEVPDGDSPAPVAAEGASRSSRSSSSRSSSSGIGMRLAQQRQRLP